MFYPGSGSFNIFTSSSFPVSRLASTSTFLDLQNSSYPTQPHLIIAKYLARAPACAYYWHWKVKNDSFPWLACENSRPLVSLGPGAKRRRTAVFAGLCHDLPTDNLQFLFPQQYNYNLLFLVTSLSGNSPSVWNHSLTMVEQATLHTYLLPGTSIFSTTLTK